jgi:hypothetical protein
MRIMERNMEGLDRYRASEQPLNDAEYLPLCADDLIIHSIPFHQFGFVVFAPYNTSSLHRYTTYVRRDYDVDDD